MPPIAWLVISLIIALSFSFLSGINDAGNMMASMLSARAMRPLVGLLLVVMELLGPLVFGTAVAATIGRGLIVRAAITPSVILSAATAATLWTLVTVYLSLPGSMSHALLGGLLGSVLVEFSPAYVEWVGFVRVLILLLMAPPVGFLVGHGVVRLFHLTARRATPRINLAFRRVQVITSAVMIMAHAANDAQKTMGLIAMGLLALGYTAHFTVPLWSVVASALSLSLGMATGGWRIARKVGFCRAAAPHERAGGSACDDGRGVDRRASRRTVRHETGAHLQHPWGQHSAQSLAGTLDGRPPAAGRLDHHAAVLGLAGGLTGAGDAAAGAWLNGPLARHDSLQRMVQLRRGRGQDRARGSRHGLAVQGGGMAASLAHQ